MISTFYNKHVNKTLYSKIKLLTFKIGRQIMEGQPYTTENMENIYSQIVTIIQ